MSRLEVVILVVAFGFLGFILSLVRRRQLSEKYALLWLSIGAMGILLSIARPLLDRLSLALGISYGPSMLFLFSTIFLMAVAAHLSWEVSRLEEKTRRLAEEIALMRPRPPQAAGEVDIRADREPEAAPAADQPERRPAS